MVTTPKRRRAGNRKTFKFCLNEHEYAQLQGLVHESGESAAVVLRDMIRRAWAERKQRNEHA